MKKASLYLPVLVGGVYFEPSYREGSLSRANRSRPILPISCWHFARQEGQVTTMRHKDALKLQPGDTICYGDHIMTSKCSGFWNGQVIHVTPRGGIRVEILPEAGREQLAGGKTAGNEEWIHYGHVVQSIALLHSLRTR